MSAFRDASVCAKNLAAAGRPGEPEKVHKKRLGPVWRRRPFRGKSVFHVTDALYRSPNHASSFGFSGFCSQRNAEAFDEVF